MTILKEQLSKISEADRKAFFAYCLFAFKDDFTDLFRDWLSSFEIVVQEIPIPKAWIEQASNDIKAMKKGELETIRYKNLKSKYGA